MNTILLTADTLPEVYHKALTALSADADGEVTIIMKALKPLEEPMIMQDIPSRLEKKK